jgi:hypothetical protein
VRIIPLKHSDAKELAATINQLYATQNSSARGGSTPGRSGFPFNFGRGGNNDNNRGN